MSPAGSGSRGPVSIAGADTTTIVGVGEYVARSGPTGSLRTYALGSCLGVAIYDPAARVGGLAHCALPTNRTRATDVAAGMFVDTGIPALLEDMLALGALRNRLVVKVAGGARSLGETDYFLAGERNFTALRQVLWRNDLLISSSDIGGSKARTLTLHLADGRCSVLSQNKTNPL